VTDGTVIFRRIHRLKDQQEAIAMGRVERLLPQTELRNMLCQNF